MFAETLQKKKNKQTKKALTKFIYDETPNEWFAKGPISIDHEKSTVPFTDAHFHLCGCEGLKKSEVPANQIHYEFFDPHGNVQCIVGQLFIYFLKVSVIL
jgi:ferredoxin-NADP reductase